MIINYSGRRAGKSRRNYIFCALYCLAYPDAEVVQGKGYALIRRKKEEKKCAGPSKQ